MRTFPLWLCVFFLVPVFAATQRQQKPPGITIGDQVANAPLEKPMEMHTRQVNLDQVKQETEELRKLANALPAQIDQVANNQLPKDLSDNLKKIEKLARHLRSEVTP